MTRTCHRAHRKWQPAWPGLPNYLATSGLVSKRSFALAKALQRPQAGRWCSLHVAHACSSRRCPHATRASGDVDRVVGIRGPREGRCRSRRRIRRPCEGRCRSRGRHSRSARGAMSFAWPASDVRARGDVVCMAGIRRPREGRCRSRWRVEAPADHRCARPRVPTRVRYDIMPSDACSGCRSTRWCRALSSPLSGATSLAGTPKAARTCRATSTTCAPVRVPSSP